MPDGSEEAGFNLKNLHRGYEIIMDLLDHISIQDWLKIQNSFTKLRDCYFPKSDLIDLDINAKIIDAVQIINENNLAFIALSTNEKSQLLGLISTQDVITFLVDNYKGEIDFYSSHFTMIERSTNNVSHCQRNQHLVKASYMDPLVDVLKKMRDNHVSTVFVERSYQHKESKKEVTETVGMVFLTDLMYLFRQVNFFEILQQPVIHFVMHLNGSEEDLAQFEDRMRRQGYNLGDVFNNLNLSNQGESKDSASHRESKHAEEERNANDADDKMDGDGDGDDKDGEEEFFNFHPKQTEKLYQKKKTLRGNQLDFDRKQDEDDSVKNSNQGIEGRNLQIDSLFGRIFGIERVHILNKNDRLQDVIEKISIIPENKLVFVENTTVLAKDGVQDTGNGLNQDSDEEDNQLYQVRNILTLGDLLTYLCPSQ